MDHKPPPAQAPLRGDDTPVMEFVVEAIRDDVDRVLDGDLQPFITGYLRMRRGEKQS